MGGCGVGRLALVPRHLTGDCGWKSGRKVRPPKLATNCEPLSFSICDTAGDQKSEAHATATSIQGQCAIIMIGATLWIATCKTVPNWHGHIRLRSHPDCRRRCQEYVGRQGHAGEGGPSSYTGIAICRTTTSARAATRTWRNRFSSWHAAWRTTAISSVLASLPGRSRAKSVHKRYLQVAQKVPLGDENKDGLTRIHPRWPEISSTWARRTGLRIGRQLHQRIQSLLGVSAASLDDPVDAPPRSFMCVVSAPDRALRVSAGHAVVGSARRRCQLLKLPRFLTFRDTKSGCFVQQVDSDLALMKQRLDAS